MPRHRSPEKALRKSTRENLRNRIWKSKVKTAVKAVEAAPDAATAQAQLRTAVSLLDKAARRKIIHPNAAARVKSHLAKSIRARVTRQP